MPDPPPTQFDKTIRWFKDHRSTSIVLVLGACIIAIGSLTDAITKIHKFFTGDPPAVVSSPDPLSSADPTPPPNLRDSDRTVSPTSNSDQSPNDETESTTVTVVLPVGVIDNGDTEETKGSTRAKGSYEIRFDGQNVLIKIDFDVRKSGVSGTGKGRIGLQILDAEGNSVFKVDQGLTVGANALTGTASKVFNKTYTLFGEPVAKLGRGGVVAFNISADDSLGFPANLAEWNQLLGRDFEEVMAELRIGEAKEINGWLLKRIGE